MRYEPTENALAARAREAADSSKLVEHISTQRKFQIENFLGNDPKVYDIEKKFGKYLAVPIDVPKFELDDPEHFKDWYFKHAIKPVKQNGDYVAQVTGPEFSPFYSVDLIQKVGDDWDLNMHTDEFKKEFPKLWQQFHESLPVKDILTLNLWSSVQTFSEHRDSAEMWDGPNSFRIPLYDENPESTLYVMDNPTKPYNVEDTFFLPQLEETNTYMWNNLRCVHGSVKNDNYSKILAVVIAIVDLEQYETVLNRSIEKYKDHCLVSKYTIDNYVNV
jgi:hypothetical protein